MGVRIAELHDVPILGRLRICLEYAKSQDLARKIIVDIGCSTGLLAHYSSLEGPQQYIGIDVNQVAVQSAYKNVTNANFLLATGNHVPLRDNTADVIIMYDVIEHVPNGTEVNCLKEAYRILKQDGILLLSTPNSHLLTNLLDPAWYLGHRHYRPSQLKNFVEQAGLKLQSSEVRGSIWSSIYMIWFYFVKWILRNPMPRNTYIEKIDDQGFDRSGVHTIFIVCKK